MRRALAGMLMALAAGCATQQPIPITPRAEIKDAPVVRRPLAEPAIPPQAAASPSATAPAPAASIAVPPNTLYVCVADSAQGRKQTAIEFEPKVATLCKRHPEMGPCQYEREVCRRSGGRVYAANGQEITRQIEDEYDRKVLRVRFRAN